MIARRPSRGRSLRVSSLGSSAGSPIAAPRGCAFVVGWQPPPNQRLAHDGSIRAGAAGRIPRSHPATAATSPRSYGPVASNPVDAITTSATPANPPGVLVFRITKRVPRHGARRTRTAGLLGAIQALSQLSYSPERAEVYPGALGGSAPLEATLSGGRPGLRRRRRPAPSSPSTSPSACPPPSTSARWHRQRGRC
jgi:hypothetical protein